jgi:hypothetical protein
MAEEPKVCIDKFLEAAPKVAKDRMALVKGKTWGSAYNFRIRFLGGSASIQERVRHHASRWLDHANVFFTWPPDGPADIRIAFAPGGSWSYIGKDAVGIAADKPTMNFGWLTDATPNDEYSRVVLHEFGHALGCIHEHQHPQNGIQWNKPVVYAYYAQQGWNKDQVDSNVFAAYDSSLLVATKTADSASIMMYPIPPGFANVEIGWNRDLSSVDKTFIHGLYS